MHVYSLVCVVGGPLASVQCPPALGVNPRAPCHQQRDLGDILDTIPSGEDGNTHHLARWLRVAPRAWYTTDLQEPWTARGYPQRLVCVHLLGLSKHSLNSVLKPRFGCAGKPANVWVLSSASVEILNCIHTAFQI